MVIDERGRVFGKINIIDLAVLLFVVLLLPLAYGAWVLFRTPPPRVTSVTPNPIVFKLGNEEHIQVHGDHLRPFLRARLNASDVQAFSVSGPESAELRFADLVPGTYDLVLFDESQEVSRLSGALTILPSPVQIVGEFDAPPAFRERLAPGMKFGSDARPVAEVLDRTTIRATCELRPDKTCVVAGTVVQPGATLQLTPASSADPVAFHVKQLRLDAPWTRVAVRLMSVPETLARVHAGDTEERGGAPPQWDIQHLTVRASIVSTGEVRKNQGTFTVTAAIPQAPTTNLTTYGVLSAAMPVDALDAELLIPIETSNTGLMYRGIPIRPGAVMNFETSSYRLQAVIMSVENK